MVQGYGPRSAGPSWPRRAWRSGPARGGSPPTPTRPCRRRADRCPATAAWSPRCAPRWAGGAGLVVGKPEPQLFRSRRAPPGAPAPAGRRRPAGHRHRGRARAGMAGLLVLTGVSTPADLLAAPAHAPADLRRHRPRGLSHADDEVRVPRLARRRRSPADGGPAHRRRTGSCWLRTARRRTVRPRCGRWPRRRWAASGRTGICPDGAAERAPAGAERPGGAGLRRTAAVDRAEPVPALRAACAA